MEAWNYANIAKLIWAVTKRKDLLWVKWVHGRYLCKSSWWESEPKLDVGWYWRKIDKVKEVFKWGSTPDVIWH